MFSFYSASSKGEDMKAIIDGLIIGWFIIINYMSVLAVIWMSPASTFGKIVMCIFETLSLAAALKCLEELE